MTRDAAIIGDEVSQESMLGLIFTYGLTVVGATVSLLNPFAGLLVYVCFAIVRPEWMWYWAVPQGSYSRIVALALVLGWSLRALSLFLTYRGLRQASAVGGWRLPSFGFLQLGRAWPVVAAILAYGLWAMMSAIHSFDLKVSLLFVEALAKIVIPFLVGITTIDSVGKLRQLAWVIVLSEGYVALEFNQSYFGGFNRVYEIGFGDMDNNSNAIALVTCIGLAFFLALHEERWWLKGLAALMALLMVHATMFSFSRGGMLALIVTSGVTFFLIPKRAAHYLAFGFAILLGLQLAGPQVRDRFVTIFAKDEERDASAQSRLDLWRDCLDVMAKNPVFGVGPDHWPLVADEYGWPEGKEAHTLWLQIGAELGIPGLLFLLSFYGLCVVRLWRLTRDREDVPDPWLRYVARMVIASIVGFAVSAQFVSLKNLEIPYYVVLLGAGALKLDSLMRAQRSLEEEAAPAGEQTWPPGEEEPVGSFCWKGCA